MRVASYFWVFMPQCLRVFEKNLFPEIKPRKRLRTGYENYASENSNSLLRSPESESATRNASLGRLSVEEAEARVFPNKWKLKPGASLLTR